MDNEVVNEAINEEQFNTLSAMLKGAYDEISLLSRKRSDGLLNSFKMKDVKRILKPLREVLKDEPSFAFLEDIDGSGDGNEDIHFTYSDMAIILNHYIEAVHKYRAKYFSSIADWKI